MFNYLFITNIPEIALFAESCGINRIFIDLETKGKVERQGHLDTVISQHDFDDIHKVKSVLKSAELLVRLNPFNENSSHEVEKAISSGADIIMLPMIGSLEEVSKFGEFINGRAKFIPLVETIFSSKIITEICSIPSVSEVHIGLNDLHLEFRMKFMFELLSNGYVEKMVSRLTKPFGIGGIARVGEGAVNGESVMAQHVLLKSSGVILSRAFHMRAESLNDLKEKIDLKSEVSKLNSIRDELLLKPRHRLLELQTSFIKSVNGVVSQC